MHPYGLTRSATPLSRCVGIRTTNRGSRPMCLSQQKSTRMGAFLLAALHGFEPRLTESESAVLPLDDSAMVNSLLLYISLILKLQSYFQKKF